MSVCTEKSKLTHMRPISPTDIDMLPDHGDCGIFSHVPQSFTVKRSTPLTPPPPLPPVPPDSPPYIAGVRVPVPSAAFQLPVA